MRSPSSIQSQPRTTDADPLTGARAAVWLAAAALGIALGLNVGLPLPHPALAPRGQAQSNQAEVAVLLFPDLEGDGDFAPDCIGCDGVFASGDRLFAERNPLPRIDVTLTDVSGTELTMHTRSVAPGRQETLFRVDQPGAYTVTLRSLPPDWQLCPNAAQDHTVVAADFDAATRRAAVRLALTRGCRRVDAAATVPADPTRPAGVPATAPPDATAAAIGSPGEAQPAPAVTARPADDAEGAPPPPPSAAGDDGRAPGVDAGRAGAGAHDAAVVGPVGDAAAPSSLDGVESTVAAARLPETGGAGVPPIRRSARFALIAAAAAVLGAGGRHLRRRPTSSARAAGPGR